MSEYLIQDSTLTDIADAIRAKDGSSAPILTEDMANAIAAIPSGGGWELIAEATTTEDVEAFRVDIPAAKQNMASYIVEYDCTLLAGTGSTALFPCPRFNSINSGSPYMSQTTHYIGSNGIAYSGTGYRMLVGSGSFPQTNSAIATSVKYVAILGFYAGNLVAAGSTIKVYGIGVPS